MFEFASTDSILCFNFEFNCAVFLCSTSYFDFLVRLYVSINSKLCFEFLMTPCFDFVFYSTLCFDFMFDFLFDFVFDFMFRPTRLYVSTLSLTLYRLLNYGCSVGHQTPTLTRHLLANWT